MAVKEVMTSILGDTEVLKKYTYLRGFEITGKDNIFAGLSNIKEPKRLPEEDVKQILIKIKEITNLCDRVLIRMWNTGSIFYFPAEKEFLENNKLDKEFKLYSTKKKTVSMEKENLNSDDFLNISDDLYSLNETYLQTGKDIEKNKKKINSFVSCLIDEYLLEKDIDKLPFNMRVEINIGPIIPLTQGSISEKYISFLKEEDLDSTDIKSSHLFCKKHLYSFFSTLYVETGFFDKEDFRSIIFSNPLDIDEVKEQIHDALNYFISRYSK